MKASTHTEVYRRFGGVLAPARPRFLPLYRARLRVGLKRKLPLFLLFLPPWISGIVFSFVVYTKFTLEQGLESPLVDSPVAAIASATVGRMIEVHSQIVTFAHVSRLFALLAITWFGAGLICEDRRSGVHQLYLSRPITRADYFLAHYATACTFGAFVVLGPVLLICLVAVFSSPDYAFLTQKWDVIAGAILYSLANVAILSLVVLAVSSVSARKVYALAGVFAVVLGSDAVGLVLWRARRDSDAAAAGILTNFRRLADWMLAAHDSRFDWPIWITLAALSGVALASGAVIAWRLRRMEVVA